MCHERSYIDFSLFQSALVVGKIENNELFSNGVGKTTIFKAIEYVLFNQADVNLEKIIRDDTDFCKIVLNFYIDDQEYRIIRQRTKKGITDLSLLQKNSVDGKDEEVYHASLNDIYNPVSDEKYWKDISGRRAADTEKELEKLLKINFKSFRSTVHFLQNDFSGLTTSTPEKRKALFKDALNLIIYSKLEKITKDKASLILKEIEKNKILIESIGNPAQDIINFDIQVSDLDLKLNYNINNVKKSSEKLIAANDELNKLNNNLSVLENKCSNLLFKEKNIIIECDKLVISINEYKLKKSSSSKTAKEIINNIKILKDDSKALSEIDFSKIDSLNNDINYLKEKITYNNVYIKNNITEYEKLKIPIPNDNVCPHCRQVLTPEHKKICQIKIIEDMEVCQKNIKLSKKELLLLNNKSDSLQKLLNDLIYNKKKLDDLNSKIQIKNNELNSQKEMYNEYSLVFDKYSNELLEKNKELEIIRGEIENSSLQEVKKIKRLIEDKNLIIIQYNNEVLSFNKEISHLNAIKAVTQHNIVEKNKDKLKLESIKKVLIELEKKYITYPSVIQAFSSTGIPNFIIQNELDDLQEKSNEMLSQIKPGMQILFSVEKTKDDGTEADTLDIHYLVNGKERYYEQLSGAMKLAVTFSLKLGLSFLLQEIMGTDIKFLLLDEIDQSLDKASVDAFADIIKFFQKDYTILIITHNDRLKDKFSHAILVEQDLNMISRARVVNSW